MIEEQASTIDDLLDEREIMQGQIDALLKEVARLAAEIEIPIVWAVWAGGE